VGIACEVNVSEMVPMLCERAYVRVETEKRRRAMK
jgi:hypothetical protein